MKQILCALVLVLAACPGGDDGGDPGGPGEPGGPDDRTPPTTTASPEPRGVAQAAVRVTLTTSEPATTYVTLDGSEPTTASPRYTAPIVVDRTRTVRFFSVDVVGNAEAPRLHRYRIDTVRRLLLDAASQ